MEKSTAGTTENLPETLDKPGKPADYLLQYEADVWYCSESWINYAVSLFQFVMKGLLSQ